ncbi:MAG: hypothetical protein QOD39_932 [Mycobacterium sp.]|nr:hypothetical protein [Mycobacterium sp.]
MTRLVALPHLQTTAVDAGQWLVTMRGETAPVGELLSGWDYTTPLHFACDVTVDADLVRQECALGKGAEFDLLALYWSSSTNRRDVGGRTRVTSSERCPITFDVDPSIVGGRLMLRRQLVLVKAARRPAPFAASEPGAVLWDEERRDRTAVLLEGDAARFPTEVLDFRSGPVAEPEAAWWLDHDFADPDASPLAALRLYVNSRHPRMEALLLGTRTEPLDVVAAVLAWDVARTMITAALDSPAFVDGWGNFRPGSLGEVVEHLLGRIWPSQDPRSLRSMKAQDPGLFEARLQGRLRVLGDA